MLRISPTNPTQPQRSRRSRAPQQRVAPQRVAPQRVAPQRGMALIWSSASVLVIAGIVLAGAQGMLAEEARVTAEFSVQGQAHSIARAGLVDAFAWMRRQTTQPVTEFTPQLDLEADVPLNETDDASIGLVRTFEITQGIWGRYEVRRGRPMDPFSDLNANGVYDDGEPFVDLLGPDDDRAFNPSVTVTEATPRIDALMLDKTRSAGITNDGFGDGRWTPATGTRNIAGLRGLSGDGAIWRIESRGMVYRRQRDDLPLGVGANVLLGQSKLVTEVRRLVISPPASAAICVGEERDIQLGGRVRIRAEHTGIAIGSTDGSTSISSDSEILAPSRTSIVPDYFDGVRDVFGVEWAELKSMADVSTSMEKGGIPDRIKNYSLVVIDGDLIYDESHPLRGMGVLVVRGSLTIDEGSNSFFNGVIYVDGDVTVRAPAFLRGTLICTGHVYFAGTGDYVEMEHEPGIVNDLLTVMGQYRITRGVYAPDRELVEGLDPANIGTPDPTGGGDDTTTGGGDDTTTGGGDDTTTGGGDDTTTGGGDDTTTGGGDDTTTGDGDDTTGGGDDTTTGGDDDDDDRRRRRRRSAGGGSPRGVPGRPGPRSDLAASGGA